MLALDRERVLPHCPVASVDCCDATVLLGPISLPNPLPLLGASSLLEVSTWTPAEKAAAVAFPVGPEVKMVFRPCFVFLCQRCNHSAEPCSPLVVPGV